MNGFYYPFDYEFEFDVDLACVKDNGEILWCAYGDVGYCGNITSITSNNTDNTLFDIYPNPNNGEQVSIVGDNLKTIELLNVQGQLIKSMKVNTNEVLINIENQAKGIYFVKAQFKNGVIIIKKLVVN